MLIKTKSVRRRTSKGSRKLRGVSLLEALLALGLGGIVIVQSIGGLTTYNTGLKVQATAGKLAHLNRAADRYAEDNFQTLIANAPQEQDIAVLEPYLGDNIGPDAFGNSYRLTTRVYPITVEDPVNGGTKTENGLQVLVYGQPPAEVTVLEDTPKLRADIANAAGSAAGFISTDYFSCNDPGTGLLRDPGHVCGAYGAYSFDPDNFAATDLSDAAVVSLVTKGDSSVYGDQLYRYDYGDEELNTMHTDLFMNDNNIHDADQILGTDRILFDANDSVLESEDGARLAVRSGEDLRLQARNGQVQLNSSTNEYSLRFNDVASAANPADCWGQPCTNNMVELSSTNGRMRITSGETVFGDKQWHDHGTLGLRTGTGNIWANIARIENVQAVAVNSLFQNQSDALRLQSNRNNGEVIVGRRVRYTPDGDAAVSGIYEISDGELTAQHVQVQDVTCADCGGSLSRILPKWRHMGTYFIPSGEIRQVPKPACYPNRTTAKARAGIGDDQAYLEASRSDQRYEAKIILIPRQFAFRNTKHGMNINFRFHASDVGDYWMTQANVTHGLASALAQTYCVFVGGDADPTTGANTVLPSTSSANWLKLE